MPHAYVQNLQKTEFVKQQSVPIKSLTIKLVQILGVSIEFLLTGVVGNIRL